MHFLSLPELGTLARLSKSWRQLSEHDYLWREPYKARFKISDSLLAAGSDAAVTPPLSCKEAFARRLLHPQVGDRVEVAWRGKFRLESLEVFSGLAWWLADVVARSDDCRRYKVHYPGWEPRWDEWVSRERLRWGNDARAARLLGHPVEVGDTVEVWCGGVHVPGAWLEGRVSCIRSDRAYLGDMLAAGTFSIPLARCRLVRKAELMARGEEEGETVRRRSLNVACMAAPCGCSVM
ncbi:hypothetical protein JKP88DRAFT_173095 [Tribonema minus]|uniref:F-box domain-containing protein n=1 Tax=Tribonema minus TaxID=303371 RepID=A0A835ZI68_9STRA|nr:hypothetical protein JKP88DRAFT_173095 [Tribonema minus]